MVDDIRQPQCDVCKGKKTIDCYSCAGHGVLYVRTDRPPTHVELEMHLEWLRKKLQEQEERHNREIALLKPTDREKELLAQNRALEDRVRVLRRELNIAYSNNHERNVELEALHYVWCDGGCESGVHRLDGKGPGEISEERGARRFGREGRGAPPHLVGKLEAPEGAGTRGRVSQDALLPKPGPELDAVVAAFMGYRLDTLENWPEYWPALLRTTRVRLVWVVPDLEDGAFVEGKPGDPGGSWRPWRIPKYSEDIAEAWKAFLKIREIDKNAMLGEREVWLWQDYMGPNEGIYGENGPHAIALAAKWLVDHPDVRSVEDLHRMKGLEG
jgi:hypothetical protein